MKASYENIPSDTLIQLINSSYELDQMTNKWMFGEEDHHLLSSPHNDQIRKFRLQGKHNEQIIMNNQDLFNVNYSKSVYVNKINSLIEIAPTPQESSFAIKKDQKAYIKAKKLFEKDNGYYQKEQDLDDSNKIKLAKNRQSARDSRKRKKIYVELLEMKVAELSKQIEVLQKNLDQQNLFINHCVKIPSLISDFNLNYQNQFQNLSKNITKKQLQILDKEFGVNSEKRDYLCNVIFNTLVDHILPFDLKKTIDAAINHLGIFKVGEQQEIKQLIEFQQQFTQHYNKFELAAYDMAKSYEYIKREAEGLEKLKLQLIQLLGPQKYVKNILDIQQLQQQIIVKEEDINQKGHTKFEL
ncbi:unnamed protein product [Paramecium primaurelia]|uniref:BZIP domain-containing protein n=1 Tax=Paramecium primaurelia TaxID=5886 RepID=A0A8S1K459_PARPR|nr:unnamed protein product [Paramecium primaurelia]